MYRQVFLDRRARYHRLLDKAKTEYHKSSFKDCSTRELFQKFQKLSTSSSEKILPTTEGISNCQLAENFSEFFKDKIKKIRQELETCQESSSPLMGSDNQQCPVTSKNPDTSPSLKEFQMVDVDAIEKLTL